jgi:hypothetical protein
MGTGPGRPSAGCAARVRRPRQTRRPVRGSARRAVRAVSESGLATVDAYLKYPGSTWQGGECLAGAGCPFLVTCEGSPSQPRPPGRRNSSPAAPACKGRGPAHAGTALSRCALRSSGPRGVAPGLCIAPLQGSGRRRGRPTASAFGAAARRLSSGKAKRLPWRLSDGRTNDPSPPPLRNASVKRASPFAAPGVRARPCERV